MNVTKNSINQFSIFRQRFGAGSMMKSTQEKLERQQKTQNQIEYWENQKENLKQVECDTVEDIAKKLEMFHSYEDEINAAKKAYNFEQMRHVLDEAEEQGRKIAEAAEKNKPKTEEERKKEAIEEAIEEAAGIENTEGILDDLLEELPEEPEKLPEELETGLEEELEKTPKELETGLEGEELEKIPEELETGLEGEEPEAMKDVLQQMSGSEKLSGEAAEDLLDSRERQMAQERYANTLVTEEADKGAWLNYRT